jgi:hypothetical protein
MTRHISQFQLMWLNHRSRSSPVREWWAATQSYMGQMFDKTRDQIKNWWWDNPRTFGGQVDCSNLQTNSSGKRKCTGESFTLYGSNDYKSKIEPPSCQQCEPGDILASRPLNWDEIIDEDDVDDNWAEPGAPSGGRSHLGNGNGNDDGEGEEHTQGGEKWTGKERQQRMRLQQDVNRAGSHTQTSQTLP